MNTTRTSGLLLHPTSLPSRFGIGDLGPVACDFIDFLSVADQSMWQVLPLGPTGFGDSPYQCLSAFAGNHLLISPERLIESGLLDSEDCQIEEQPAANKVNFGAVIRWKERLLHRAFDNFKKTNNSDQQESYSQFKENERDWLDEYALFRALKEAFKGAAWIDWPDPLRQHQSDALRSAMQEFSEAIEENKFRQYLFFKQWHEVRSYCHERGIEIVSDLPIFVAFDSVDVWAAREMFKLRPDGRPVVVAGVPPDYFSATGQLWGNPIYDWDEQKRNGFQWWVKRVRKLLELSDLIRIDHFRGFVGTFEIEYGERTAENGRFVDVPGPEIFTTLRNELGKLPIIAEDLGMITPDVVALRDQFGFPGMRILQMAFRDQVNPDLPHNYVHNCVVYTGTHDHDTARGWFDTTAGADASTRDQAEIEKNRAFCLQYLNTAGKEIHWDFIRAALASVGNACIIPVQDLLGLGSEARMNRPAVLGGNWTWRLQEGELRPDIAVRLKALTRLYCRGKAPLEKAHYGY